jgi:hypothetical protein
MWSQQRDDVKLNGSKSQNPYVITVINKSKAIRYPEKTILSSPTRTLAFVERAFLSDICAIKPID